MKLLGTILAASLILAVLRAAIIGMAVTLLLLVVWGVLFRPRETFGFLGLCLLASFVQQHTVLCLVSLAIAAAIVAALCSSAEKHVTESAKQPLLPAAVMSDADGL